MDTIFNSFVKYAHHITLQILFLIQTKSNWIQSIVLSNRTHLNSQPIALCLHSAVRMPFLAGRTAHFSAVRSGSMFVRITTPSTGNGRRTNNPDTQTCCIVAYYTIFHSLTMCMRLFVHRPVPGLSPSTFAQRLKRSEHNPNGIHTHSYMHRICNHFQRIFATLVYVFY